MIPESKMQALLSLYPLQFLTLPRGGLLSAEWINECLKVWVAEQTWDGADNTGFNVREIEDTSSSTY